MWHKKEEGVQKVASSEKIAPVASSVDHSPYEYQRASNETAVSSSAPGKADSQPKNYFAD